MIRFATRYAAPTFMRQNRPLTTDELMRVVPSAFSAYKHESRSERSGKDTVLPPHPPLRTVLASFPAHGSSLSKPH